MNKNFTEVIPQSTKLLIHTDVCSKPLRNTEWLTQK